MNGICFALGSFCMLDMDIKIEQTKWQKRKKYVAFIAGGIILSALLLWLALGRFSSTLRVKERDLSVATVEEGKFDDYIYIDGQAAPIRVVQISTEEGGIVREKVVEEGAHVKEGDVIVQLSNSNLDLEIMNAESELAEKQNMLRNTQISMEQEALDNKTEQRQQDMEVRRKQRAYEQQKALWEENLIAKETYLQAEEDWQLAVDKQKLLNDRMEKDEKYRQAQLDQMNDNLANMRQNVLMVRQRKENLCVRSAINGELGSLNVELGQNVAAGQTIGQVNDLSDYKITAQIDQNYLDCVSTGLKAVASTNDREYQLTLKKIYPEVKDQRFRVDFVFDGERPENIRSGQTFHLDLQLGDPKTCIFIPKGTFYGVTNGNWIFVLDKEGRKAYRRKIRIGIQNARYYEVLEGLEPGESVILNGYDAFGNYNILKIN